MMMLDELKLRHSGECALWQHNEETINDEFGCPITEQQLLWHQRKSVELDLMAVQIRCLEILHEPGMTLAQARLMITELRFDVGDTYMIIRG